jgi:uncharacterized delta-60 repeat protein
VKGEAVPTEIGQRRFLIAFALFAIFGLALATPARSAPGSLDKAFSGDGKVRVRTHYIDEAHDMALDTNGRIVLVGITWIRADGLPTIEVMRLTPTGALDGSFSRNGRRTLRFGRGGNVADAVAIQPDGRIVIVGHRYAWARNGAALMGIARLLPGGRLDRSFSGDGRREVDLPYSREDAGESLAVQEDGKIVIGGEADDRGALVRLRPSGRLDYSFGRRGHVLTEEDGSRFTSLALQPNGRILGATDRLVRYLPEGSPDASFGESGVAIDPAGPRTWGCLDIALQKNGKIVCSSAFINDDPLSQSEDAAVLRWRQDGVPDSGFGTDGVVVTGVEPSPGPQQGGSTEEALSVVVQPDGKIITAGWTYSITPGPYDGHSFLVIRYLASGERDSSFGEGGIVRTQFTGWIDRACTVALRGDGRIVVGGTVLDSDMAVARYLP